MSIFSLFDRSNFSCFYKPLAKEIGLEAAVIFSELCSVWQASGEKEFSYTYKQIEDSTTISDYQITKALKSLEKFCLISIKKVGKPPKNYFTLYSNVLENFILNKDKEEAKNLKTPVNSLFPNFGVENTEKEKSHPKIGVESPQNWGGNSHLNPPLNPPISNIYINNIYKKKKVDVEDTSLWNFDANNSEALESEVLNDNAITQKLINEMLSSKHGKSLVEKIKAIGFHTKDSEIRNALVRYLDVRSKTGLTMDQWNMMLTNLFKDGGNDKAVILYSINKAYESGYRTIFISKQNKGYGNRFFDTSANNQKHVTVGMTHEERFAYIDANQARNEKGELMKF